MLSSTHGLGADQILSLNLVTPDGRFMTASPYENTDLFWAIRGGGGSSFGVVTSAVIKAHKDTETAMAQFQWGVKEDKITFDTFWDGVRAFHSRLGEWADEGTGSTWEFRPQGFRSAISHTFAVGPFVAPGFSAADLRALLKPFVEELDDIGIKLKVTYTQYPSYVEGFFANFPPDQMSMGNTHYGYASRLLPRASSDKSKALNATIAALRALGDSNHALNAFHLGPTAAVARPVAPNAVHPAWRDALVHLLAFVRWPANATATEQMAIRTKFSQDFQPLRDATPGSGSYMNEADRMEPNFQKHSTEPTTIVC